MVTSCMNYTGLHAIRCTPVQWNVLLPLSMLYGVCGSWFIHVIGKYESNMQSCSSKTSNSWLTKMILIHVNPAATDALVLTHWGRVRHLCVGKLTIIGSNNGLSPGRRQAIIWPNAGMFLIGPLWTNFNEILIEIPPFSFKKMRLKVSSAKWRPFCLSLNVLKTPEHL